MRAYKRQGQIEERIKIIKGPLSIVPNFLRDPKRIASLVFVVIQASKFIPSSSTKPGRL